MPDKYFQTDDYSFVWDEDKDRANLSKHGIDFKTAALVFNDDLRIEYLDEEHSYDEERYNTIGLVHDVLFVVYCDRENTFTQKQIYALSRPDWLINTKLLHIMII